LALDENMSVSSLHIYNRWEQNVQQQRCATIQTDPHICQCDQNVQVPPEFYDPISKHIDLCFNNLSNFNDKFKQHTGYTPSDYAQLFA
jgi:AraC-like DNA-binding protein